MKRTVAALLALVLAVAAVSFLSGPPLGLVETGEYETATVAVHDANGTQLATVDVRVADTREKRRVGLSRTGSLADGEGMLFVHPEEGEYAYHMREMSFPLDIVFVAGDGSVTRIHHAPVPEGEASERYRGTGKYVLEVPRGWTNESGVSVGDTVSVPGDVG